MRVFIIDATNLGSELRRGLIGIVGGLHPTVEEKGFCVDMASRYVADGWALAADPCTPLGRLVALVAEAGCAPFVSLGRVNQIAAATLHSTYLVPVGTDRQS